MGKLAKILTLILLLANTVKAESFTYISPGQLKTRSGFSNSSVGLPNYIVHAPGIRFPIEKAPAYALRRRNRGMQRRHWINAISELFRPKTISQYRYMSPI